MIDTAEIKIAGRSIGKGQTPFIIAEMSGNHNQSIERALQIVEAAARAGAHALKIQTYTPDTMTLDCIKTDFIIQGGLVGLLGTAIGVTLGVTVALNIDVIVPFIEGLLGVQFLPRDVYLISALPSDLRWPDVIRIGGIAVVLAFLATLYPSWRAARVRPAEALRYE